MRLIKCNLSLSNAILISFVKTVEFPCIFYHVDCRMNTEKTVEMGRGDRLLFACLIKYHGKQLMYTYSHSKGKETERRGLQ